MSKKIMVAAAALCFAAARIFAQTTETTPVETVPVVAEAPAPVVAETAPTPAPVAEVQAADTDSGAAIKYIAAGLAVGLACIAGGMAVGKIGAAAMGAMSENAELSGKALPFVGLAEGICLWGFLVALLIIIL